jgi:hypothetical protein
VRGDGTGNLRNIEHAFLALLDKQVLQFFPNAFGALRGRGEERAVAVVRRVILLEKPPNVDIALPQARCESAPGILCLRLSHNFFLFG